MKYSWPTTVRHRCLSPSRGDDYCQFFIWGPLSHEGQHTAHPLLMITLFCSVRIQFSFLHYNPTRAVPSCPTCPDFFLIGFSGMSGNLHSYAHLSISSLAVTCMLLECCAVALFSAGSCWPFSRCCLHSSMPLPWRPSHCMKKVTVFLPGLPSRSLLLEGRVLFFFSVSPARNTEPGTWYVFRYHDCLSACVASHYHRSIRC